MGEAWLTGLLAGHRALAIPLSLLAEVVIAVAGVLPSFAVTAANVAVFGLYWGTALSIAGESIGAVVAFALYRSGLSKASGGGGRGAKTLSAGLERLARAEPRQAFLAVLAFRLLPYVPSGAVTLAAAGSRLTLFAFTLSSTLGKIPALAVEVATVSVALRLPWKLFLALMGGALLVWLAIEVIRGRRARARRED